jgi:hypothetical protein
MTFAAKKGLTWGLKMLPVVISVISLIFAGLAFHRQTVESELQLWNSLRREFDRDMKKERKACGAAFEKGDLQAQYGPVMDFFETIGFLVHTGRIHDDLFDNTWGYYFSGYFQATKPFMVMERKRDPSTYEEVFWLSRRYPADRSLVTPDDLKAFFEDEQNLPE